MARSSCSEKKGLKKGAWTAEEDQKLLAYIEEYGHGSWQALPAKAGLRRCGKSCRLRWTNYLRPDIKRGKFSLQEEQTIIQLHALLGNKWSTIATHLPKRTDNEIKNYWNTHLKKRLEKMGIDPVTHKPKAHAFDSTAGTGNPKDAANLSHMAQWESARLEAEARLVRESMFPSKPLLNQLSFIAATNKLAAVPSASARPKCLDVLKAWQGMVSGMFFHSGDGESLDSPTSTLNSSENGLSVPQFQFNTSNNNNNSNNNIACKENVEMSNAWGATDSFMAANEGLNGINITNGLPDFMEIDHHNHHNSSSSSMAGGENDGNIINLDQDSWTYWNSLLSFVDPSAAASASPAF